MKTAELTDAALDWAVAKCEGQPLYWNRADSTFYRGDGEPWMGMRGDSDYCPSTDWAHGGPIIEQWMIDCGTYRTGWRAARYVSTAPTYGYGPTPLIAAMRCYVASKLGDEVELPSVVEKIGP